MDKSLRGLKQEINEVKDLVQEMLRRMGKLEFRGMIKYGEANNISQKSVFVDCKLDRMVNGELIGEVMEEQQKGWDKLKGIKIDIPKHEKVKIKPNRKLQRGKIEMNDLVKNDKRFEVSKMKKIDEMEWLNLLQEIRHGFDAFQRGDFTKESVREQSSAVILNRVKSWLKDKEV